jgi:hypothetical protein
MYVYTHTWSRWFSVPLYVCLYTYLEPVVLCPPLCQDPRKAEHLQLGLGLGLGEEHLLHLEARTD